MCLFDTNVFRAPCLLKSVHEEKSIFVGHGSWFKKGPKYLLELIRYALCGFKAIPEKEKGCLCEARPLMHIFNFPIGQRVSN